MLLRLYNYFRFYLRHIQTFSSIIQEHARAYLLYLLYHGTIIWLCFPNDHMTVCSMTIFTHCNFTVTWRFQVYVTKNDILHRRFCIVFSFFMFITEIPMCKMLFFVKWKTYRYALCLSCQTITVKYFSVKHFFFCETRKLPNFFTPTFMKIVSTKLSLHSIVVSMSRNSLL